MPVQDDSRERELVRMFNLVWDRAHQRSGVDAYLDVQVDGQAHRFELEVKSTTRDSVGSARDVGIEHIAKWRTKFFVVGFYTREAQPELERCLCLSPADMDPWIVSIQEKIALDFRLAAMSASRLRLADLFDILGKKDHYSMADAKSLHKRQWTDEQYKAARDLNVGNKKLISQEKMLSILQLRARYISERGATLNNPKLEKTFLSAFFGTDREVSDSNSAAAVRQIAVSFAKDHPSHPAVIAARAAAGPMKSVV